MKKTFRIDHGAEGAPREVRDEIAFHLEMRTKEFMEQGLDAVAARRAALASFGDVAAIESELRVGRIQRDTRRHWGDVLGGAWQELRLAARALRRTPGFTATVVLTLALGIGALTAAFSVVNAVLLRHLPFPEPDRLVAIGHSAPGVGMTTIGQSRGSYFTYRRLSRAFTDIGAYENTTGTLVDPRGASEAERVTIGEVTPSLLTTLRVPPMLGRAFSEAEGAPRAPIVAILSRDFWMRRFGGDRAIIGRTMRVNETDVEVIGVMPADFRFPDASTQLYVPMQLDPGATKAGGFGMSVVARLRPGESEASARADVLRAFAGFPELYPTLEDGVVTTAVIESAKMTPRVQSLQADVVGDFFRSLWMVAATAALVLLVAALNVSNLMLVRGEARQRELTVRAALGAGRGRVVAQFVAEAMVLGLVGGALGVALGVAGVGVLRKVGPAGVPRLAEVSVDGASLLVGCVAAFVTALLAVTIPAWRQGRVDLARTLRDGGRSGTSGRGSQRVRGMLVAAQMAFALVLLGGCGLMLRSVLELRGTRPGFDGDRALTFRVGLPRNAYPSVASRQRFHDRVRTELLALPGVRVVGASTKLPLAFDPYSMNPIWSGERTPDRGALPPLANFVVVTPSYFAALGVPLLAGRTFSEAAGGSRGEEVVISRRVAAEQWGDSAGTQSVGKRLRINDGTLYTVVGVVEGVRDSSLTKPPSATVYFPVEPARGAGSAWVADDALAMAVVVRVSGDPAALVPAVRRVLRSIDSAVPVFRMQPMAGVVAQSYASFSFLLLVLGVAAGVTLLLGGVGLYGVVAYVVSLRRQELGVRLALGASPWSVGTLAARQGVVLGVAGAAVGLVLFAGMSRLLRTLLYGVTPTDPLTLGAVTLVLVAIAVVASWVPARRASRLNPVEAMRTQ